MLSLCVRATTPTSEYDDTVTVNTLRIMDTLRANVLSIVQLFLRYIEM